jgi:hypothetical protein
VLTRKADEFFGSYHDGPLLGRPSDGYAATAPKLEQPFIA